jgi:hypothetical protein
MELKGIEICNGHITTASMWWTWIIWVYILWLVVMLPVSLQVLDAGEGGGGMSSLSAVSLCRVFLFPLLPGAGRLLAVVTPDPLLLPLLLSATRRCSGVDDALWCGVGAGAISLKRHRSVRFHAAFSNWPTLGTPPDIVKPENTRQWQDKWRILSYKEFCPSIYPSNLKEMGCNGMH